MPRLEDEPLQKVHILLYADDVQWIMDNYGRIPGFSKFIRLTVRKMRRVIEAKAASQASAPPKADIPEELLK